MSDGTPALAAMEPPVDLAGVEEGEWVELPLSDPLAAHLTAAHWAGVGQPAGWQVARLANAVYLYRERASGWIVVAKYYTVKTGSSAAKHAAREMELIGQAREAGLRGRRLRPVQPLGVWRGVLFLEHVRALSLEDEIAVRRSRPGRLGVCLDEVAELLAVLHAGGVQPGAAAHFAPASSEALEYVDQLVQYGVLKDEPLVAQGVRRSIGAWAERPEMEAYFPALTHGDATTTNFLFPAEGGVVAIDWERLEVADPAADLGRLMAEVAHSVGQHGGRGVEVEQLLRRTADSYVQHAAASSDPGRLLQRARFYRAASTLRIARNGWLSRLRRTALVAQAMALLAC